MTPEDRERLDAISDALARMALRQQEFDDRLAALEGRRRAPIVPREAQREAPPPPPAPAPVAPPPSPVEPNPNRDRQGAELESAFGLTWISRIGALTLVIGVAFFFKYAFENYWITETGRVLLGIAGALTAMLVGERLFRNGQRIYSQALTATGIAFLYLSWWAGHVLYLLFRLPSAFALMTMTTVVAGMLALRYDGAGVAYLALTGGYLTPLLLDVHHSPWLVLGYALLLSMGAAWLARRWRSIQLLAFSGACLLYGTQLPPESGERIGITLFTLALYAVFAGSRMAWVAIPAQTLSAIAVGDVGASHLAGFAPLLLVTAGGLVMADRRRWSSAVPASLAGFWLGYEVLGKGPSLLGAIGCLTIASALFLAWPVWRARKGLPLRFMDLAVFALSGTFYFGTCYDLLRNGGYAAFTGLFAVATAVVHMGAALLLWRRDRRGALLGAGIAWVLVVLAVPIQFSQYRVTMAWSLEAAALAWMGSRLREDGAVIGSLFVFLMAMARLLVVDSWMFPSSSYTLLANARFLTMLIAAASLWAAARWTRDDWPGGATFYIGGHLAIAWGLCLEASGWAARTSPPETVESVQSIAISILLAVYALGFVAGGVMKRSALNRVLGIGLIGFVVVKLYLYDVWFLGLFYRMAAFAILGVLLLSMSYLYSRFRETIENWWRP